MSVLAAAVAALGLLLMYDGVTAGPGTTGRERLHRVDALLEEAGIRGLSSGRLAALCVTTGVLAFGVVAGVTTSLVVAGAFGAIGAYAPVGFVRARRARRQRSFREAWPDAIATLVSGVRAGISLPEACVSLVERGPEALRDGFSAFSATYRATGSFAAGLARLRTVMSDPVADRVAAALRLAHDVGGTDLVRVLRALGDFVRDDLRVRKEIEARWSWTVTAARVAAAAPWAVLLLMGTRPEAARAYATSAGAVVVAAGAVATLVGYRLMLRAARLPAERRLGS